MQMARACTHPPPEHLLRQVSGRPSPYPLLLLICLWLRARHAMHVQNVLCNLQERGKEGGSYRQVRISSSLQVGKLAHREGGASSCTCARVRHGCCKLDALPCPWRPARRCYDRAALPPAPPIRTCMSRAADRSSLTMKMRSKRDRMVDCRSMFSCTAQGKQRRHVSRGCAGCARWQGGSKPDGVVHCRPTFSCTQQAQQQHTRQAILPQQAPPLPARSSGRRSDPTAGWPPPAPTCGSAAWW